MPAYFDGEIVFIHIPKCAGNSVRKSLSAYQRSSQSEILGLPTGNRHHESLLDIQTWFISKWGADKWGQANVISTIRHPIDRTISWWKYRKKILMKNFLKRVTYEEKGCTVTPRWDAMEANQPYISPEDYATYHGKHCECYHVSEQSHVEAFSDLTFHDYVEQMTVWKKSGCDYPFCPLHALAPQAHWLCDITGTVQTDRLGLFLVENLEELERFLPEMPKIGYYNVVKEEGEDYRDYLTTASLLKLNRFYAEDFKLYRTLRKDS